MAGEKKKKTPFEEFSEKWLMLHSWVAWTSEYGVPRPVFLGVVFVGLLGVLAQEIPNFTVFAVGWVGGTAPVWLPIMLYYSAWSSWVKFIRSNHLSSVDPVLLEIKIPRDITKSPRAIEAALSHLWTASGETTLIQRVWLGRTRPFFSLEFASLGGELHFYIWCWGIWRNMVEAAFYAQFPDIEISRVEDYATKVQYDSDKWDGFVTDYKLSGSVEDYKLKKDAKAVLPIKSYIDFELEKDPKEEFKIDPLAQIFEWFSNLKPHEQIWVQIICRSSGKDDGPFFPKKVPWDDMVKTAVEKIRAESLPGEEKEGATRFPNPTYKQRMQIEAIERHAGKLIYDVMVRSIYMADKTRGNVYPPAIGTQRMMWKPVHNPWLNDLGPDNDGGGNMFNYPWQDFRGIYRDSVIRQFIDAYRRRSAFYTPWRGPRSFMSVEAIATIWHFPSATIQSPGIRRIPATKASAPPNLPL